MSQWSKIHNICVEYTENVRKESCYKTFCCDIFPVYTFCNCKKYKLNISRFIWFNHNHIHYSQDSIITDVS